MYQSYRKTVNISEEEKDIENVASPYQILAVKKIPDQSRLPYLFLLCFFYLDSTLFLHVYQKIENTVQNRIILTFGTWSTL